MPERRGVPGGQVSLGVGMTMVDLHDVAEIGVQRCALSPDLVMIEEFEPSRAPPRLPRSLLGF